MTVAPVPDSVRARDDRWQTQWGMAAGWVIVAVLVRIAWLSHSPAIPAWDGAIYHRTAVRIAAGMGFVDTWNNTPPFRPTAFYPVGYPAILGAAYAVLGAKHQVAGLLNVIAAGVCALFIVYFARRTYGGTAAHVAAGLYAFSPGAVIYTSAFMTETVSAALLCGAIACGWHHARTRRISSAVVMGLLLGAGGLVRPPALLIAPVLALFSAPARGLVSVVRTLAIVGIACCAVVLPWTARNCRALDGCALVSVNGGSNLWIGADPAASGGYRDLRPGEGCDHVHGEVAKDRCYGALAMRRIGRDPFGWLALAPLKIGQLLGYETTPVSYLRAATHGTALGAAALPMYGVMTAWHRLILGLAVIGLAPLGSRRTRRIPREVWTLVACIVALIGVHVVFFGVDRYHFVFLPLLCVLAGAAFRKSDGSTEA